MHEVSAWPTANHKEKACAGMPTGNDGVYVPLCLFAHLCTRMHACLSRGARILCFDIRRPCRLAEISISNSEDQAGCCYPSRPLLIVLQSLKSFFQAPANIPESRQSSRAIKSILDSEECYFGHGPTKMQTLENVKFSRYAFSFDPRKRRVFHAAKTETPYMQTRTFSALEPVPKIYRHMLSS